NLLLTSPTGAKIPLRAVADIQRSMGPNEIYHENSRRRIYVFCNVAGADLSTTVAQIEERIRSEVEFHEGYTWTTAGQYEQLLEAPSTMADLSLFAFLVFLSVLIVVFRSFGVLLIILVNIPLAPIGSVLALNDARATVNVGALVGFN